MRKQIITIAWIISISALTAFTITAQTLLANQNEIVLKDFEQENEYSSLQKVLNKVSRKEIKINEFQNGNGFEQSAKLFASDGSDNDSFGVSVAISGDTAIIGADYKKIGKNNFQGAAYVFVRNRTLWTERQQLIAPVGAREDYFGVSVGIFGDNVIVGAYRADVGANPNDQGAAYIFVRSGGVWMMQQQLTAEDGATREEFGSSVFISGNIAVVGAYRADVGGNEDQGAAYIFRRFENIWTQEKVTSSDGNLGDFFGYGVALSGNHLFAVQDWWI